MIYVTKTYLPPLDKYVKFLEKIWESGRVTNNGPLVQELEAKLKNYLGVKNLIYVTNGTIAIQLSIKALKLKGEIITTPFSYVATTSVILWENCKPVFVDIENKSYCIDPNKIERAITKNTCAIIATHVYGHPCNLLLIKEIANKHNLHVIYDGAHAFGTKINGQSILNYGDISTISFHATKVFHTIQGGAIITKNDNIAKQIRLMKSFGHIDDDHYVLGINGKNSEFHAAIGLCNLDIIDSIISRRKKLSEQYKKLLNLPSLYFPEYGKDVSYNYAYFPVVFSSETLMLKVKKTLDSAGINLRRYFYPSLNNLPYCKGEKCVIGENISSRICCFPLYHELSEANVEKICMLTKKAIFENL